MMKTLLLPKADLVLLVSFGPAGKQWSSETRAETKPGALLLKSSTIKLYIHNLCLWRKDAEIGCFCHQFLKRTLIITHRVHVSLSSFGKELILFSWIVRRTDFIFSQRGTMFFTLLKKYVGLQQLAQQFQSHWHLLSLFLMDVARSLLASYVASFLIP